MTIWIDAQLSPAAASWISINFAVQAAAIRDFVGLLDRLGAPPKIIWLICGNTSNKKLQEILTTHLSAALDILANDDLVEIYGS